MSSSWYGTSHQLRQPASQPSAQMATPKAASMRRLSDERLASLTFPNPMAARTKLISSASARGPVTLPPELGVAPPWAGTRSVSWTPPPPIEGEASPDVCDRGVISSRPAPATVGCSAHPSTDAACKWFCRTAPSAISVCPTDPGANGPATGAGLEEPSVEGESLETPFPPPPPPPSRTVSLPNTLPVGSFKGP